jgi:hypothetical protein
MHNDLGTSEGFDFLVSTGVIRMAVGVDDVLEGQFLLLDEINQVLLVPGRIYEKGFFGSRTGYQVTENVHESDFDLFNDHSGLTLHFPMQAFGRNQIEVEKEVAFIH